MKHRTGQGGFVKFGDALAPGGAMYVIRGSDRAARLEYLRSLAIDMLRAKGVPIDKEALAACDRVAERQLSELEAKVRSRGVPIRIRRLFAATTKRAKEKVSKKLVLTSDDFAALISNCGEMGFAHRVKHLEFVPDHLERTKEESDAFFNNGVGPLKPDALRFQKKQFATFSQRRVVTVHLFESATEWHAFYFSYQDIFGDRAAGTNHWEYGTHVHYISHHWRDWTADRLWQTLEERQVKIPSLHIRYVEDDVSESAY